MRRTRDARTVCPGSSVHNREDGAWWMRESPYGGDSNVMQPPLEDRVFDDVDAAGEIELAHRVGPVGLRRFHAQIELLGDFLVAVARGDQPQDLGLALGDGGAAAAGAAAFAAEKAGGDARGQAGVDILPVE